MTFFSKHTTIKMKQDKRHIQPNWFNEEIKYTFLVKTLLNLYPLPTSGYY
jgi:hypothetical protein